MERTGPARLRGGPSEGSGPAGPQAQRIPSSIPEDQTTPFPGPWGVPRDVDQNAELQGGRKG